MALLLPYAEHVPAIDPDAWLADNATVIGQVRIAAGASVWFTAVIRGDGDLITIGAGTNVQDGCVFHADPGLPVRVGAGVAVGHRAVLHGCTVEDRVMIGMGATVLNGARIGTGSLVAAGAVVLEGTDVPPGSLVAGVPAKVRRATSEEEQSLIDLNTEHYRNLARDYAGRD